MTQYSLGEVESAFANLIWDNEPLSSSRLVELCGETLDWKKSTTYTVIKKLCERGFICNENATVSVLVEKEQCQRVESDYFIERTFGGSLPRFIAAFLGDGKQLSEEEAEEIKQMIDAHRKK